MWCACRAAASWWVEAATAWLGSGLLLPGSDSPGDSSRHTTAIQFSQRLMQGWEQAEIVSASLETSGIDFRVSVQFLNQRSLRRQELCLVTPG